MHKFTKNSTRFFYCCCFWFSQARNTWICKGLYDFGLIFTERKITLSSLELCSRKQTYLNQNFKLLFVLSEMQILGQFRKSWSHFTQHLGKEIKVTLISTRLSIGSVDLMQIFWVKQLLLSTWYLDYNYSNVFTSDYLHSCPVDWMIVRGRRDYECSQTSSSSLFSPNRNPAYTLWEHSIGTDFEKFTAKALFRSELKCQWRHILCISVGI